MGNKRALAASAGAAAAKAFSSQSDECEIAAERCSLRLISVLAGGSMSSRRGALLNLPTSLIRSYKAESLSPSYCVTLDSTSTNSSGDPSN